MVCGRWAGKRKPSWFDRVVAVCRRKELFGCPSKTDIVVVFLMGVLRAVTRSTFLAYYLAVVGKPNVIMPSEQHWLC